MTDRGYSQTLIENLVSGIKFTEREYALLEHNTPRGKRNITFRDTVPALSVYFKRNLIMESYTNQPLLCQFFKQSPIISYKKGKSLKGMLVRAKIKKGLHKVSRRYVRMFGFSPLAIFSCKQVLSMICCLRGRYILSQHNQQCSLSPRKILKVIS